MSRSTRFAGLLIGALTLIAISTPAAAEDYVVDPTHSSVIFKIRHLKSSEFFGRFNDVRGTLKFDAAKLKESSVRVEVKASSVDTNSDDRDNHVRSEEFLHADKHPTIVFEGTGFESTGPDTFKVKGKMMFRGITKEMTVTAKRIGQENHPRFGKRIGFSCTFEIKRSEFGIEFPVGMLSDEVQITVGIEGMVPPEEKKQ